MTHETSALLLAGVDVAGPIAVLTARPPYKVLACNPAFQRLTAPDAVEGRPLGEILAPGEAGFDAAVESCSAHEIAVGFKHTWRAPGGVRRHAELMFAPIPSPDGRALILCQVRDITSTERDRRVRDDETIRHAALRHVSENTSLDVTVLAASAASTVTEISGAPVALYLTGSKDTLRRSVTRGLGGDGPGPFPENLGATEFIVVRRALANGLMALKRDPMALKAGISAFSPRIRRLSDAERALMEDLRAEWLVATPLCGPDRVLGVILSTWRGIVTPVAGLRTLDLVAGQVAISLERARLYEETLVQRVRLDLVLQQIPDGVWMVDAAGCLVLCNPAAQRLLGIRQEESSRFLDALDQRVRGMDPRSAALGLRTALAGDKVLGVVDAFDRGEPGEVGWLLVSAAPILDGRGAIMGAVAVASDVSDHRRAELTFSLLADVGETLGGTLDTEASLARVAELCAERLGDWCAIDVLTPEGGLRRIASTKPGQEVPGKHLRSLPAFLASLVESGTTILCPEIAGREQAAAIEAHVPELTAPRSFAAVAIASGHRPLGVIQVATRAVGRRLTTSDLLVLQEIARRSAAALENARLFWAVQEADRRKDEFIAVMSHELRTPLTSVLGWATMLQQETDPDRIQHGLDVIARNARLQLALVNDLLDLAAIRHDKLTLAVAPIDLGDVLRAAVDAARETAAARQVRVDYRAPTESVVVLGDATRLEQVFGNLLSNALKFTPASGLVTVEALVEPDAVAVAVRDNGQGIEPAFLPSVFDLFSQSNTRSLHRGLGVGLALAQRIVQRHGGSISARSDGPDRGSEFVVRLPRPQTAAVTGRASGDARVRQS